MLTSSCGSWGHPTHTRPAPTPPHAVADVAQLLRLVEHHDDHPTSSNTPIRATSCRSPCNHTHPLPPLQTSCPARPSPPGSIWFTGRTKRPPPPAPPRC